MTLLKTSGFVEISSSSNRKIVWYYAKNVDNIKNYYDFLHSLEPELANLLKLRVQESPIKFNLKLEATYNRPHVENSSENRAFKTSAVEIFTESDIIETIESAYMKLMGEKEYTGRGSGFTLETIDGLLLAVYKYTPMTSSSYINLPAFIDRKRGTINPQNNNDEECFKWAILAKHVTGDHKSVV